MAHSISTSSTNESPSPVIFKRKRTARYRAAASSASSNNEEEVDMANCLILLAKGRTFPTAPANSVYECKTCNKSFSSFQALGGHRASHKKPKVSALDAAELASSMEKAMDSSSSGGGKQRTHECSICRFEFSSGQALGGHMRKHRSVVILENSLEIKKENRALLFDLNLPAPIDEENFVAGKQIIFSPPPPPAALVDCQY